MDNLGLEAFLAIVRAQNVSKAAENLHLAQSSWGPTYQLWHDQWWTPSRGQVHVDSVQLIVMLLRDSQSWAIVPLSIAKKALSQGIFSISYLSEMPPNRVCYKLTHKYPKTTTVESLKIFDHYLSTILQSAFEI